MPAAVTAQKKSAPAAGAASSGGSTLKLLGAVVLSAGLLVVAASFIGKSLLAGKGPDPEPLLNLGFLAPLGFEPVCLRRFGRFDFFSDAFCFKHAVNKVLGYGVVAGSATVKLPQIRNFMAAGSADGASPLACYLELGGYLLHAIWHVLRNHSPFSAYGETILVSMQSAAVIALIWYYRRTGVLHMLAVLAAFAGTFAFGVYLDKDVVFTTSTAIFSFARVAQIVDLARSGDVGELSLITLLMQFAGSAARVSTTMADVGDRLAVGGAILAATLNGTLVAQYLMLRRKVKPE